MIQSKKIVPTLLLSLAFFYLGACQDEVNLMKYAAPQTILRSETAQMALLPGQTETSASNPALTTEEFESKLTGCWDQQLPPALRKTPYDRVRIERGSYAQTTVINLDGSVQSASYGEAINKWEIVRFSDAEILFEPNQALAAKMKNPLPYQFQADGSLKLDAFLYTRVPDEACFLPEPIPRS